MKDNAKSFGLPRKRRRFGRAQNDPIVDTYKLRKKLPDPTRCPSCGAVYHDGRWQWPEVTLPSMAHEELCTACHRINDKYPAGIVTIRGAVVRAHREEMLGLVRNTELAEKSEHCQNRLMAIEKPSDDVIVVTTTDIHLPRRIGEALHRAFHGDLQLHYDEDAYFVRVEWQRDS